MDNRRKRPIFLGLSLSIVVIIAGCVGQVQKRIEEPTYFPTRAEYMLEMLPPPVKPMNVAMVLEDMTGQYKHQPNVANFSTAVSQAVTELGVRAALKCPQWFLMLERKGINYLSMERNIMKNGKPKFGTPLKPADFIILGGVSQFERDIVSGGAGFRLLGIGASNQYAIDSVVVDLRMVDPMDGRIVMAVSASKRIFSFEVRANVFKYVDDDNLMEGEVGGTDSEPAQLCVREALEKAMFMLCVEMGLSRQWPFKNIALAMENSVIKAYFAEKIRNSDLARSENSHRTRKMLKNIAAEKEQLEAKTDTE